MSLQIKSVGVKTWLKNNKISIITKQNLIARKNNNKDTLYSSLWLLLTVS